MILARLRPATPQYIKQLYKPWCIHSAAVRCRSTLPSPLLRSASAFTQSCAGATRRHLSQTTIARQDATARTGAGASSESDANTPIYEMTFTCKKCESRSTHRVSKQGYHHGTVLITCPGCKNRHLISDHLKIFSDTRVTLEDIMKEKGQLVKRGSITTDGDVEFWAEQKQESEMQEPLKGNTP